MNVLTGVILLLLSMLIVGFLQLRPSILLIFLHYASAKYSKKRVSNLTLFYILGSFMMLFVILMSLYFITAAILTFGHVFVPFLYILAGVLGAIGILFPLFYYHKGQGTRLFISRKTAKGLVNNAKTVHKRSDALVLGVVSGTPELFFTMPIYLLLTTICVDSNYTVLSAFLMTLFLILATAAPLFLIRGWFARCHNIAVIQKARVKNKVFVATMVGILYIVLGAMTIARLIYAG